MKFYTPIIIFLIYAIIMVTLYIFRFGIGLSKSTEVWGQLGDFMGGSMTPVVSLIAIIYAIESFRKQSSDSRRTQFETNLFELLRVRRELISNLKKKNTRGIEVIDEFINYVARPYADNTSHKSDSEKAALLVQYYEVFYKEYDIQVGHILRNLYNIYLFIEKYTSDIDEQYYYARFLRSQLTALEIVLIGLNGLSKYGTASRKYIERFALLNNFESDKENIMKEWRDLLETRYSPSAFGRTNQ